MTNQTAKGIINLIGGEDMKKFLVLMLAFSFIFSGCSSQLNDEFGSDNSSNDFVGGIAEENAKALSEKYNQGYLIDEQYIEEYKTSKDMADMDNITTKYANLWQDKVNHYSKSLSEHIKEQYENDEVALEYVQYHNWNIEVFDAMQKEWEEYAENQIKNYQEFVCLRYWSGTAAGSAMVVFEYDLYRNRAIELYEYCELWGVEVPQL